ncbi:FHA domain-containing protein [Nodularia harveyana]|nr:FHA domain-containing protein [Nodularia harveyana]
MESKTDESHRLIIEDNQGRKEFILQQTIYSVGRGKDCNIRLASQFVSRRHATLVRMQGNNQNSYYYRIVDGDATGKPSANGLIINDNKISVHNLKNEDEIVFGPRVRAIYYLLRNSDISERTDGDESEITVINHRRDEDEDEDTYT